MEYILPICLIIGFNTILFFQIFGLVKKIKEKQKLKEQTKDINSEKNDK